MKKACWIVAMTVALAVPAGVWAVELSGNWVLKEGVLTYRVSHPLHKVKGESREVRGKGVCGAEGCSFLVAAPVRSFLSGDGNRDAHMWQVTKAGLHPLVQVRVSNLRPGEGRAPKTLLADAEAAFAGKTVKYPDLPLEASGWEDGEVRLKGVLPLSLKAFGIEAPSLLTFAVEDRVPVELELIWERAGE